MKDPNSASFATSMRNFLLALWAILLFGGLVGGRSLPGHLSETASLTGRMGSSIILVLLSWFAFSQGVGVRGAYSFLLACGMSLGCLGDFFNANLMTMIPLTNATLGAIIAFGLGHVCYIVAIVIQMRVNPSQLRSTLNSVAIWQLIGFACWYWIVYLGSSSRSLVWPALGYTLLLAGTAGVGTALAQRLRSLWPLAMGAALFLLSDLLLAYGMFRGTFPFRSEAVWLTYGPGQMLIVFSIWLVHRSSSASDV